MDVLVRTGSFGEGDGWLRSVREVVGWLESVREETVSYVEQLMGYVSSKVYAASAAATAESPFSPLMRAALSPAWPTSSSSSSPVIGLLCLVLSSLLSLSNPERLAVASVILNLPTVVAADEDVRRTEAKESKETEEEVEAVKVNRRNELLVALLQDERFVALSASASHLLSATAKARKTSSKCRAAVTDPVFHRLMKLTAAQWKDSIIDLSQEAEADASTRHSLLLALAVSHKVPLLSLPRVHAALAEQKKADEGVVDLVHSLPLPTLFLHASRQGVDLHFMPEDRTFSRLCEHWMEQARSEPQRLVLVMDLSHHLLMLLHSASADGESTVPTAIVQLLSTLHTLVLSSPLTHSPQRLSAMLQSHHDGLRLIDFFLSSNAAHQALSNEVSGALGALLMALLKGGDAQQKALVDDFLQRLVDACVSLTESSPLSSSSSLPLPLTLLQQLSSYLRHEQLDRLSTAFLTSSAGSASAAWWAVLCEHVGLAQLLLASRPAEAFNLITRLSTENNNLTATQRDALDGLLLQLLHPHNSSAASPSAAVSMQAYLVPEAFFSAALQAPSPPRLRIVDALLQSTASPVYVHLFAVHIHAHVNKRSPRPLLLSLLPPLRSYIIATSPLPSSLLPTQHHRVISLLSDMLESFVLPGLRRGEVEASQNAKEVEGLVQVMLDAGVLQVKARRSLLQAPVGF